MKQTLSARIAWRYLRAKKSHSAVGAISVVSICGIAVATAAIICVLSVFNGFRSVIAGRLDTLAPEVMVTPAKGKVIANGDSLASALQALPEVEAAVPSILDNALLIYNGHEMPVLLKGVNRQDYAKVTAIKDIIIDSRQPAAELLKNSTTEATFNDEWEECIMSVGVAARLGIRPGESVLLFTPRREGRVNLANPASSFLRDSVTVAAVYKSDQSQYDENRIVVDIDLARDLFQYDSEASAIEIKGSPGISPENLAAKITFALGGENIEENKSGDEGEKYVVKDRLQQQEMNFRMISIEKWVSFLLLFFILLIASFNIISSLSMLVLEKENSIHTLTALGMSRRRIGSVFFWESLYVTFIGGLSGVIIGIVLSLLQEKFGFIKLQGDPGSLIVWAYPVEVRLSDILVTLIPVILVGLATALITAAFARARAKNNSKSL